MEGQALTKIIDAVPEQIDARRLAAQLVEEACAEGIDLVGPDGLLTGLTKTVLETALEAEMSEHLGYDQHDSRSQQRQLARLVHVLTLPTDGPAPDDVAARRPGRTYVPMNRPSRIRRHET